MVQVLPVFYNNCLDKCLKKRKLLRYTGKVLDVRAMRSRSSTSSAWKNAAATTSSSTCVTTRIVIDWCSRSVFFSSGMSSAVAFPSRSSNLSIKSRWRFVLSSNFLAQFLLKKRPSLLLQRPLVFHFSCRSTDLVYPAQQMPEWFLPGTRMRRLWFSRLRKRLLL